MELFEYHFSGLTGNLYYDIENDNYEMYSHKGVPKHINYLTFKELFKNMSDGKALNILETGIASCGTNSTYLFNEYVRKYGGRFWSVDINQELVDKHSGNMCPATTLTCMDSVKFINEWGKNHKADIVYLDSYDMDWYNPHPSAEHGLKEYQAVRPILNEGAFILIDDTPISPYWFDLRNKTYDDMVIYYNKNGYLPGKGQYVINQSDGNVLLHNYQILYKY
jgi:hypothetical protein